jgi:hypothetical protein
MKIDITSPEGLVTWTGAGILAAQLTPTLWPECRRLCWRSIGGEASENRPHHLRGRSASAEIRSMLAVQAVLVMREGVDDPALGDAPLGAGLDHAFHFHL